MPKKMPHKEYDKRKKRLEKGEGWCTKCKQFLSIVQFSKDKKSIFGHLSWCRACHSKARKGNSSTQRTTRNRARQLTGYYIMLAGGTCQRCGYNKTQYALDFHHINAKTKAHNPSHLIGLGNHENTMRELNKCILLCANCHREHTATAWTAEFIKRAGLGWTIKPKSVIETDIEKFHHLPEKYRYIQSSFSIL